MDKNINWNRLCQEINKKAEEAESERLNTSDSEKSTNSNVENSQEEESDALNSEEKIDQVIAAMTMQANQTAPDSPEEEKRKKIFYGFELNKSRLTNEQRDKMIDLICYQKWRLLCLSWVA